MRIFRAAKVKNGPVVSSPNLAKMHPRNRSRQKVDFDSSLLCNTGWDDHGFFLIPRMIMAALLMRCDTPVNNYLTIHDGHTACAHPPWQEDVFQFYLMSNSFI